jgi:hypothetical protein
MLESLNGGLPQLSQRRDRCAELATGQFNMIKVPGACCNRSISCSSPSTSVFSASAPFLSTATTTSAFLPAPSFLMA